ncbi:MAG: hypothetical protein HY000_27315 [Planctomycetes bacterium]|nr:hypothetical protein [Planctomycetota bacterium]
MTMGHRVYEALRKVVGLLAKDLEIGYQQMAQDEAREREALAWAEATVGDVADETR